MNMILAHEGFPARAMAVYGLTADLSSLIGPGRPARALATQIWPEFATKEAEIIERRSPARWADKIMIPVLLMHGGDDTSVPPGEALTMAQAFERAQIRYELKIFYGEGHVLGGRSGERDADAANWFRRFDRKP